VDVTAPDTRVALDHRDLLSPDDLADAVTALEASSAPAVHVCVASAQEHEAYKQDGGILQPWPMPSRRKPRPSELLLGITITRPARIIDICAITQVVSTAGSWEADWDPATDLPLHDILTLVEVKTAAGIGSRQRYPLEGPAAAAFMRALSAAIRAHPGFADIDGTRGTSSCRRRSAALRTECLRRDDGRCQACGDCHETLLPGRRRWAALDAHHLIPLAKRASDDDGSMITSVEELITLCATCHRLVHADDDLSVADLEWAWIAAGRTCRRPQRG
jgi:hypothetical protein